MCAAAGDVRLNGGGVVRTRELLLLRLLAFDDGDGEQVLYVGRVGVCVCESVRVMCG